MSRKEKFAEIALTVVGLTSVAVLALIIFFIFKEGSPALAHVGLGRFVGGTRWSPGKGQFGILPMIVGSFFVTFGALLTGVPLGLGCASTFRVAPRKTAAVLAAGRDIGDPWWCSVHRPTVIVPLIRDHLRTRFSVLASAIVLGDDTSHHGEHIVRRLEGGAPSLSRRYAGGRREPVADRDLRCLARGKTGYSRRRHPLHG